MWGELARSLQLWDPYILLMFIAAFIGLSVAIERLVMLQFVYNLDFQKFLISLRKIVLAEDLDRALNLCKNASHTSLPMISHKALEAAEVDPTRIRGVIEEEAIAFLPLIEKRLAVLPVMTLFIMLFGILGTIDSLWAAFHSVDVLDTAKKQATIAQGIAGSLNPTALGLSFGIVLLAFYHLLRGAAVGLIDRLHHGLTVLTNLLAPAEMATIVPVDGGSQQPAPAPAPEVTAPVAAPVEAVLDDGGAAEDEFDDVAVDDIKDEEEII